MNNFSIIIPIYNEEAILEINILKIEAELKLNNFINYEIILIENGSNDKTKQIAQKLCKEEKYINLISLPYPSFGDALYKGIEIAHFDTIVLFNADWWDIEFMKMAIKQIDKYSMIIGSKRLHKQLDYRPIHRRFGTYLLTKFLFLLFKFPGTDSHGLKVFRKKDIYPLVKQCITQEITESEILIRAMKNAMPIKEIPVKISEIRPPRVKFWIRCIKVGKELIYLRLNI
jgi:glycosyltransferase AglD